MGFGKLGTLWAVVCSLITSLDHPRQPPGRTRPGGGPARRRGGIDAPWLVAVPTVAPMQPRHVPRPSGGVLDGLRGMHAGSAGASFRQRFGAVGIIRDRPRVQLLAVE